VHCFEPSTETYSRTLTKRLGGRSGVTLNNVGVGEEAGTMTLHTGASYASNSFYALRPSNELGLDLKDSEQVPVIRMDDYLQQHAIGPVRLVKIDVQGHELPVLHGFGTRLADVDYLYVEVSIHPLYEQPATLCGVLDYLAGQGFVVIDMKPNSLDGRYVQEADVLFGRKALVAAG
jgi:FkbM family methyltransferase